MKKLYSNAGSLALASDRIDEEGNSPRQSAKEVALFFAKFFVAIALFALTTTAYASHGQAKVSDIDHTGMGTFSGTYKHADGSLADHPWFVFNANAGDVITINIDTKFNGGSHAWLYRAPDGCVEVGDYSAEGTLALLTSEGEGSNSYSMKYTFVTASQLALQLDSYVGGDGAYTVTISGSTTKTVLCSTKCAPFTVNLTNDGPLTCTKNSVTLTTTGGPADAAYTFTSGAQPGGLSAATTRVSLAGPYSVTVTAPGGCSATATTIVSSNTITPSVSINPASQTICQGQKASFTAQGAATYQWSGGNGQPGQTGASISVSATGTYSVTGTGSNGCTSTASARLTVNELPQAPTILTQAGYSYAGGLSSLNVVQYSEPVSLAVSGCEGGTINWNGGDLTTLTVSTSNPGTQTFLATCTRNGCTSPAATATVSVQPGPFQLIAPSYNCQTGGIAFRTQGGNGTPIEFFAIGVTGWTNSPYQFVDTQLRTASDAGPLTLYARQDGQQVSYTFDLRAQCAASENQAPRFNGPLPNQTAVQGGSFSYSLPSGAFTDPEGQPLTLSAINYPDGLSLNGTILSGIPTEPGNFIVIFKATDPQGLTTQGTLFLVVQRTITDSPLQLLSPDYNCQSGAFRFITSGGDGTPIEFFAIGITGWTTSANQYVDEGLRTATDIQPLTLYARQSGKEVSLSFDIRARCSARSRQAAVEPTESKLQVSVLGNPVTGRAAEIEIRGAAGQAVQIKLTDLQGRALHHHSIGQAGSVERVSVPVTGQQTMLLLQVSTATQSQQIKLIKP